MNLKRAGTAPTLSVCGEDAVMQKPKKAVKTIVACDVGGTRIKLGLVRGMGALEIGEIMLVTGIAQLLAAPVAVALERRVDARILTLLGFALFATGVGMKLMSVA